ILLAVLALVCFALPIDAQDAGSPAGLEGILVAPTRIVLGPRERAAKLTLVNLSNKTLTYRISLVNRRMTEDGDLQEIPPDEPVPFAAVRLLRYSPRRITLAPDESQKIRLMVRRPADLPEGEYRSHLLIQTEPRAVAAGGLNGRNDTSEPQVTIGVKTRSALTLPVIVRHGDTSVSLAMEDIALVGPEREGESPKIRFLLQREGNQSSKGDVTVSLASPLEDRAEVVGLLRGVAVYTPNSSR
ncbi:MAG: hypothetical protein JSV90_04455, partial [Methanobacteriota archaeon]